MGFLTRLFIRAHIALYQRTGGKIGGNLAGNPILLLHTVGRKTGQARINPLVYMVDDGRYTIAASNNGQDHQPGWYYNLRHQPQTTIQVMDQTIPVHATLAAGEEYGRLYVQLSAKHPQFATYQQRTTRQIPLFILTPR